MKKFLLTLWSTGMLFYSNAQVEGPRNGATFSNVAIPGSNRTWTNAGNAAASDNVYASFGNLVGAGSYTDYLSITNFSFNIPVSATVTGILAEIERSDPNGRTSDYRIRIIKGSVIGTTDRSSGAGYSLSDSYQTFGNAGDMWGETWTPAEINGADFGIAIAAQRSAAGSTTNGGIDDVRLTVFYTLSTLPVNLFQFKADKQNETAIVQWLTAAESDMEYYTIERSANGINFSAIGQIQSANNNAVHTYSFADNAPLVGTNYYRLKMKGLAGYLKYSSIVSVIFTQKLSIALYPTIVKRGETIKVSANSTEPLQIVFYNAAGQLLTVVKTSAASFSSTLLNTRQGLLIYKIVDQNNKERGNGRLFFE
jgi:hypothetical protein